MRGRSRQGFAPALPSRARAVVCYAARRVGTSPPPGTRNSGLSLSLGLITDCAVIAYGVWTIAANAVVIAGGTISILSAVSFAVLAALLIGAVGIWRSGFGRAYLADLVDDPVPAPRGFGWRASALLLLPAALGLLGWLFTRNAWITWAGIALSSIAAAFAARSRPFTNPSAVEAAGAVATADRRDQFERLVLHLSALACAVFALLSFRPRSDDTQYLHLAVSAVDHPEQALLAVQTLHGPVSASLGPQTMFPPYRVHTFELLGGLVSYLTGIEATRVIHFGLATLLAWLTPFAVARLLKLLAPRYWVPALLVAVSFYFIEGSAGRGYANHALVRMFNGKSALLTLIAPLICAYGLRFAARPSPGRFALLALAQVAGVGLSSTGLWLVPTLGMVAVAAGSDGMRAFLKRLPWALLSSAYVIGMGLWVLSQMTVGNVDPGDIDATAEAAQAGAAQASIDPRFAEIAEAVQIALGPERTAVALIAVALVAVAAAPTALALRLFAGLVLVVAVGFANPWLASTVAQRVTGVLTYYRFFWLLPVPIMLGAIFASLWSWLTARLHSRPAAVTALAALVGFYALAVDRLVISDANQAKLIFPPPVKAWTHARLVAEEVCRTAPAGQHVLASKAVLLQLPTIHGCGHPIIADERWLSAPAADEAMRSALVRHVGDVGDVAASKAFWFIDALRHYHIDAVVVSKEAQPNWRVKSLIRAAGFDKVATVDWEHVYVRARPETLREYDEIAAGSCQAVRTGPSSGVLAPFGVSDALSRRGCARAIAAPAQLREASDQDTEALLRLERLSFMQGDAKPAERAWILTELNRRGVEVIVLYAPALGNKVFKGLLRQLGFRSVENRAGHTIVRRKRPD